MAFNFVALAFVLGITFMHSIFGLFSGLINTFCTIVAAAVAFGFVEPLNNWVTGTFHLHPAYTEPFALVVPFILTLVVLRVPADNYLRGNVHVPMYLDWAGGALCGFIIAQIIVGVMVLGFLMLPWGGRVMMYQPVERDEDNKLDAQTERVIYHRNKLWLRSDDFTVGLIDLLSSGSLKGNTALASMYPDFPEWVAWSGNTLQAESLTAPIRDEKGDGFTNGLKVDGWTSVSGGFGKDRAQYRKDLPIKGAENPEYKDTAFTPLPGKHLLGVRLTLLEVSADRGKNQSSVHRFRPTMLRLVGDLKRSDGSAEPREYTPQVLGGADPKVGGKLRIVDPDSNFSLVASPDPRIDAYFEVDDGVVPRFIEYRRHARAPLTAAQEKKGSLGGALATAGPQTGGEDTAAPTKGSGAGRFIDGMRTDLTGDRAQLPFPVLAGKLSGVANVQSNRLVTIEPGNRLFGFRSDLSEGEGAKVEALALPEGRRIFQFAGHTRKMQSVIGQALNFAAETLNQYKAVDDKNKTYDLAGYYALTKRDGKEYLEFFFAPDPGEAGFNGMVALDRESRKALREQEDSVLGLIFVVPPGTCITRIESQGGKIELGEKICVGG